MSNLISIRGLEKTYKTDSEKLTILQSLDFEAEEGTSTAIVGSSGSGKSTFLNILAGLDSATAGTIRAGLFQVESLGEDSLNDYRTHFLGLIFQFHYLLKDFTALENVFLPAFMAGTPKKAAVEKARSLLGDVGLSSRENHLPSQLSGGERQRVAVARSLVNSPSLILADEPTGNLDPENAKMIGDLLFSLVRKHKKTLILVTHDFNMAKKADRIFSIKNGSLVLDSEEEK